MSKDHYVADAPLDSREGDRLRRWPFAERIADTLAARSDPTSLVVAVYGRWGEGKTTVLRFIEQRLEEEHADSVVVVRFNPWLFTNDRDLFLGFFAQVAAAIDRQLESTKGKVGGFLKTYGGIVAGLSGVDLSKVGEELAKSTPEEARERLEAGLAEEGRRIVVLVDDIDRLDKDEAQAVFRLLKVAADFRWTSYVLAFDRDVVAAALAERYPGRADGGGEFLDKIVQVPLTLPPMPRAVLRRLLLEDVTRVLADADVTLRPRESRRYVAALDLWLFPEIDTLRAAKRYVNALQFALPMVRGEVNEVDFMLLEAIRVFRPPLYAVIAKHHAMLASPRSDGMEEVKDELETVLAHSPHPDHDRLLLVDLFPRLLSPLGFEIIEHAASFMNLTGGKRIASNAYVARFFSTGVAEDGVADWQVVELMHRAQHAAADVADELRALLDQGVDAEQLAQQLFDLRADLRGEGALNLALALAQVGRRFAHREGGLGAITSPRAQVALLIATLVEAKPELDGDEDELAAALVDMDIAFAMQVGRWLHTRVELADGNHGNLLSERLASLGQQLRERVLAEPWSALDWLGSVAPAASRDPRELTPSERRDVACGLRRLVRERSHDKTTDAFDLELVEAFAEAVERMGAGE